MNFHPYLKALDGKKRRQEFGGEGFEGRNPPRAEILTESGEVGEMEVPKSGKCGVDGNPP
jgi:hypothetical protein